MSTLTRRAVIPHALRGVHKLRTELDCANAQIIGLSLDKAVLRHELDGLRGDLAPVLAAYCRPAGCDDAALRVALAVLVARRIDAGDALAWRAL
jgi:hypothetical protein